MDEKYNDHIEILKNWANKVGVDSQEKEEIIQKIESSDVVEKLKLYPED